MELYNLKPAKGSTHNNFRKGRGHASGNGGQMPLYRRIPKRGFKNRNSKEIVAINVDVLERFEDGEEVTIERLLETRAISHRRDGVKILGNGELTKKLHVKVNAFSASAKEKIEAAGGTAEVV